MDIDKQLRILQIGDTWINDRVGGLSRYYASLVNSMLEAGINLKGLVAGSHGVEKITNGAVCSMGDDDQNLLLNFLMFHNYFKKNVNINDFDVIVSHFSLITFPLLPLLGNKPLIIQFHGPFAFEGEVENDSRLKKVVKYFIERAVYSRGSKFITLSRAFRDILIEKYKVKPEKIEIIPGGVDCSKFSLDVSRAEARERFSLPQDRPIIFCIRRTVKRMGLENLIDAMQKVVKEHPDAMLLVAGKGALLEELKERIREYRLERNARMLGFVPDEDLPVLYRAANFSIVPTVKLEGFGLIVLESLACGTPALVTPVGGLPETVENFRPELILQSSSVDDIADGISRALSGDLKLPTSEECIDYVRKNCDWSIISRRIYDFYKTVV